MLINLRLDGIYVKPVAIRGTTCFARKPCRGANEGDKWEIYLPSKLAYAERGAGAKIPPDSTLIFEVELISVD